MSSHPILLEICQNISVWKISFVQHWPIVYVKQFVVRRSSASRYSICTPHRATPATQSCTERHFMMPLPGGDDRLPSEILVRSNLQNDYILAVTIITCRLLRFRLILYLFWPLRRMISYVYSQAALCPNFISLIPDFMGDIPNLSFCATVDQLESWLYEYEEFKNNHGRACEPLFCSVHRQLGVVF